MLARNLLRISECQSGLDSPGAEGPLDDVEEGEEAAEEFEPLDLVEPGVEGLGLAGGVV